MNISDVKINWADYHGRNFLEILYEKQEELRVAYGVPICDLDVPGDQQQLRAMAWNVLEEAGEAMEVIMTSGDKEHTKDEVSDMVSFYIELFLMSGIKIDNLPRSEWDAEKNHLSLTNDFTKFAVSLSLAINTLKNRYWRMTNLKTDSSIYKIRLINSFYDFKKLVGSFGLSTHDLMDGYLRKYEVNKFRINSKY